MDAEYLLMPVGSSGDVFPFMGLGTRLRDRGHPVTLATSAPFGELAEEAGLDFEGYGADVDFETIMGDPDLWHPRKGFTAIAKHAILPMIDWQIALVERRQAAARAAGRQLKVVNSALGMGTRIACEALQVPLITVHLQPVMFWSEIRSPRFPAGLYGDGVPRWLKRFQWWAGRVMVLDPPLKPRINALRAERGLRPIRHVDEMFHGPQLVGLFPEWYAAPQADWPGPYTLTDFPLWDRVDDRPLPDDLEAFMQAGDPPIAFTPGSAMVHGHEFFAAAVDACQRLGRRGLLLTRYADQLPGTLPESVKHVEFAPFSQLLPRVAALAYHGGIGTASQAMAAGVPHLVMPMSHDQPDNAWRLKELGIGDSLQPRRFRGPAVARALERLLGDPEVGQRAREVAERLEGADGVGDAVQLIEDTHNTW